MNELVSVEWSTVCWCREDSSRHSIKRCGSAGREFNVNVRKCYLILTAWSIQILGGYVLKHDLKMCRMSAVQKCNCKILITFQFLKSLIH